MTELPCASCKTAADMGTDAEKLPYVPCDDCRIKDDKGLVLLYKNYKKDE